MVKESGGGVSNNLLNKFLLSGNSTSAAAHGFDGLTTSGLSNTVRPEQ